MSDPGTAHHTQLYDHLLEQGPLRPDSGTARLRRPVDYTHVDDAARAWYLRNCYFSSSNEAHSMSSRRLHLFVALAPGAEFAEQQVGAVVPGRCVGRGSIG